jgi:hypothetical protein
MTRIPRKDRRDEDRSPPISSQYRPPAGAERNLVALRDPPRSQEILVRRDAISKEDAWAAALLEISRLKRSEVPNPRLRNAG